MRVGSTRITSISHSSVATLYDWCHHVKSEDASAIDELTDLVSAETYVNFRHIELLADTMTNKGGIMSIDRHGINKSDRGPLAKCSFEETPDIIAKAALFGEYDKINGVSANIMLGQEVKNGTSFSDVLFDEKFFLEKLEEAELNEESDDDTGLLDVIDEEGDSYCDIDNFGFNFSDAHLDKEKVATSLPSVTLQE